MESRFLLQFRFGTPEENPRGCLTHPLDYSPRDWQKGR